MIDRRQAGFTLIELIIFIVVVSAGLAGILMVMDVSVKSSADPMVRKQTVAIAESMLEEIMLKAYEDPDGLPNVVEASRALFDDVDDYAGYSTASGMVDMGGAPIAGLTRYDVSNVAVAAVTINGVNAKRITVTVTGPGGAVDLTSYKTKY
jgi:MSHA pilin protein MshD